MTERQTLWLDWLRSQPPSPRRYRVTCPGDRRRSRRFLRRCVLVYLRARMLGD